MESIDAVLGKLNVLYELDQDAFDEVARLVIYYYKMSKSDPKKFLALTNDLPGRIRKIKEADEINKIKQNLASGDYNV